MMGREVRRVPADWVHPKKYGDESRFRPLHGRSYSQDAKDFLAMANEKGLQAAIDYFGCAPEEDRYMPDWPKEQRTHYMMYEDTTEGTPISPAFATPEELARWLADTRASAFASMSASYDHWLAMIGRECGSPAFAISADGRIASGVEAMATPVDEGGATQ